MGDCGSEGEGEGEAAERGGDPSSLTGVERPEEAGEVPGGAADSSQARRASVGGSVSGLERRGR